jgi:hypothetical protein
MKRRILKLGIAVIFASVDLGQAFAHHSFAATYFVDQEVTAKGTITEFLYRNPHSFMKVNVADAKGQVQVWTVEWGGGAQLSQDHISRDTLRPGDVVTISGNPGRNPEEHRMRLHKIVRASDNWTWEGTIM